METGREDAARNGAQRPIYPDLIPVEPGHPTTAWFEVVNTADERGRGLRARVPFKEGVLVAQLSGVLVTRTTLDTIQISPRLHMSDPWFCRFLLHSCDPNLAIDTAVMQARAVRAVRTGEYLTIDYSTTEDVIANQFACQCGTPPCRGWMAGRREQPNDEGLAWLKRHGKL